MDGREARTAFFGHVLSAMLVSASLLAPASLSAASLSVDGDSPRSGITVSIDDATVAFVLDSLRSKYGFRVDGLEHMSSDDPLTTTMEGTLQGILERLLRNRNHVIVRSPDNACGIAKVVILDSNFGAAAPKASQGSASERAATPQMQAYSNRDAGDRAGPAHDVSPHGD